MERVVYLLGAGFSAQLGLPVMSNFLSKSKEIYDSDPKTYAHFSSVLKTFDEFSIIKNYYKANLHNIEEILSILEMRENLGHIRKKKQFVKYICDVIKYYTPELLPIDHRKESYGSNIFLLSTKKWRSILFFASSLINAQFKLHNYKNIYFDHDYFWPKMSINNDSQKVSYSIITLNYDMVIENAINYLFTNFDCNPELEIVKDSNPNNKNGFCLAKLHGCISNENIIPPTWNKSINNIIEKQWRLAYKLLSEANHIRVLGYSLPDSDAYIKYLLKASLKNLQNIKSFDIICYDEKDEVRARFERFLDFDNYRFLNCKLNNYFDPRNNIKKEYYSQLMDLEVFHDEFMRNSCFIDEKLYNIESKNRQPI